ncbi:MAG: xanthine dehydrogenase accessory protein XdhC [Comamonadaceae bacterium]|nr:MAG: xanthine dehydrogenase accessory protein XdhC [Comamonadaceae bacterium]
MTAPVISAPAGRAFAGSGPDHKARFLSRLERAPAVLVRVVATQGSAPREAGTWMAVFADVFIGTIGGGHLEYEALEKARDLLAAVLPGDDPVEITVRFALGPSLGQCCGGVVHLGFSAVSEKDIPRLRLDLAQTLLPVALFGGGHVGHALVEVLSRLPFALRWVDSRDGVFPGPDRLPPGVATETSEPVHGAVRGLAPGSRVLIMSFSHAEDLDIVAACLLRQRQAADLPFVGLIGSMTKWATFRHRLLARGFSEAELGHVTCPIGIDGINGKEPEVIAVAVAAQLLQSVYAA